MRCLNEKRSDRGFLWLRFFLQDIYCNRIFIQFDFVLLETYSTWFATRFDINCKVVTNKGGNESKQVIELRNWRFATNQWKQKTN